MTRKQKEKACHFLEVCHDGIADDVLRSNQNEDVRVAVRIFFADSTKGDELCSIAPVHDTHDSGDTCTLEGKK
jgi:hypothetical protein